jgi:hypothetical protein
MQNFVYYAQLVISMIQNLILPLELQLSVLVGYGIVQDYKSDLVIQIIGTVKTY